MKIFNLVPNKCHTGDPEPTNIYDVQSFHGLVIFYYHFIQIFNTIRVPITDCLKK